MIASQIRVLSKPPKSAVKAISEQAGGGVPINDSDPLPKSPLESPLSAKPDLGAFNLRHESEATTFKLIDEKEWNFIPAEPASESQFFSDGHALMSVISVIGPLGAGKSRLLNRIANKYAFETHSSSKSPTKVHVKHVTKGIDIHVTHHRILLDCQPMLSHSVLEDFLAGHSSSQFGRDHSASADPFTSSHMISLQLAAFLIATCDYVVIMSKWLVDCKLLELIASALMMLGEGNYKAKLVILSDDDKVCERKFKNLTNSCLGMNQVDRYFHNELDLINYVSSYSSTKCDQLDKDPEALTGKKWLEYSRKFWCNTIKDSSLFADYATQFYRSNELP